MTQLIADFALLGFHNYVTAQQRLYPSGKAERPLPTVYSTEPLWWSFVGLIPLFMK